MFLHLDRSLTLELELEVPNFPKEYSRDSFSKIQLVYLVYFFFAATSLCPEGRAVRGLCDLKSLHITEKKRDDAWSSSEGLELHCVDLAVQGIEIRHQLV